MSRSMLVSVGVLVVLGVIVVVNILGGGDADPAVSGAAGGAMPALEQGGRIPVKRPASPAPETDPIPVILSEEPPGVGPQPAVEPTRDDKAAPASAAASAAIASCKARIARGEVGPALREAGHAYGASKDRAVRDTWRGPLLAWSLEYLRSPSDRSGLFDRYRIQDRDNLTKIARAQAKKAKIHLDFRFVQLLNRISKPEAIRVGQRLWLPSGDVRVAVTLSERRLDVFLGDCLFSSYPCGVGKDNKTPIAKFRVGDKIWHPTWYFDGQEIPYGDPRNELGEAWIALEHEDHKRFGIHGTNDESTVGKAVSRGCIRLKNADVTELFQILAKGAEVVIRP